MKEWIDVDIVIKDSIVVSKCKELPLHEGDRTRGGRERFLEAPGL